METVLFLCYKVIDLYSIIILISVLGSWVDGRNQSPFFRFINKLTDPYLRLFRIIIPAGNMNIDISPIIGITVLNLLKSIIGRLYYFSVV
ncbi:YggT family protein [Pseudoleptotrichia goodfellowii]|uniref:YGGT family protein n=1 Tax=Pseudoleptotrichia goodfellowii TaxID=157692 RepID=A0A510JBN9_9FUSO|nr:YggT family protein [Pseudoleptotrichia goodfellowii]BBM36739.1 YGGT family protein [Pseudoleptotrichia goodfellowii]